MSAVIFCGPSLPDPPEREGVLWRPPAEAGDLYRAARDGARVIGLIDGLFEDRATVWHKEILFALSRGVHVLGAASLGALRAVECAAFGMEGVGWVFERYRDGALEDDGAVALIHAPRELDYAALSLPLVNLLASLEAALEAGAITATMAEALRDAGAATPWRDRRWSQFDLPAACRIDVKRADALALTERVCALRDAPPRAGFAFEETRHWRAARRVFDAAPSPDEADLLDELRLDPPRFHRLLRDAYARRAAPPAHGLDPLDDFRAGQGLAAAADFRAWLAARGLDPQALRTALDADDALAEALEEDGPALALEALTLLRALPRFPALQARARAKRAAIAEPDFDEADLAALLAEFLDRFPGGGDSEPDAVARSLALPDRAALYRLLHRERDYGMIAAEETP